MNRTTSKIKPVKEIQVEIIPISRDSEKYREIVERAAEGVKTALPKLASLKKGPPPAA